MYEGRILGSNIGCISTYTLEVLIMFLIINHPDEIDTSIDVFFKFFEYDWSQYAVTIFGLAKLEDVQQNSEALLELMRIVDPTDQKYESQKKHYDLLKQHQENFEELNLQYR